MAEKKYDSVGEASIRLRFYMDGPQFTPDFWQALREECADAMETIRDAARESSGDMVMDEYGTKQTVLFVPNSLDADGLNDNYEEWDIAADLELKMRFYVNFGPAFMALRKEMEQVLNVLFLALTEVLDRLGAAVHEDSPGSRFSLSYGSTSVYSYPVSYG